MHLPGPFTTIFHNNISGHVRIPEDDSAEFSVQYPPLSLHIESAKASGQYWWQGEFNLIAEFEKQFPSRPLRADENMAVTVKAGYSRYVVTMSRTPKATGTTALQYYIIEPWDAFSAVKELLEPGYFRGPTYNSLDEIKAVFNNPIPSQEQKHIARLVLGLGYKFTKSDLTYRYQTLYHKYNPDNVPTQEKAMTKAIRDIVQRAYHILGSVYPD